MASQDPRRAQHMAGVYNQRPAGQPPQQPGGFSERLHHMLEAIKTEFDSVTQDTSVYRMQRDEFEMKSMPALYE